MAYPLDNNKEIPLIQLPTGTPDAGDFVMYTTSEGQTKIATFDQFQDGLVTDLSALVEQAEAAAAAAGDKMPSMTLSQLAVITAPLYKSVYIIDPGLEGAFSQNNGSSRVADGVNTILDGGGNKWLRDLSGVYPISKLGTITQAKVQKLLDDIGASPATLLIDRGITLTANLTVPSNVRLLRVSGALIEVGSGLTYTQDSPVTEGNIQLFSGAGSVKLSADQVNVAWFGAVADFNTITLTGTDNTEAFRKATQTVLLGGCSEVFIPRGNFGLTKYTIENVSIVARKRTTLWALPSAEPSFLKLKEGVVQNITIGGFYLRGRAGNTGQIGLDITAIRSEAENTGGLWYSNIRDMQITGFDGHGMFFEALDPLVEGTRRDIANQFLIFDNVRSFRNNTSSRALKTNGQFGQVIFNNCEFDGVAGQSAVNTINVELVSSTTTGDSDEVYSVLFNGCTFQEGDKGLRTFYAKSVTLNDCHFENMARPLYLEAGSDVKVGVAYFGNCGLASLVTGALSEGCLVYAGSTVLFDAEQLNAVGAHDYTAIGGSPTGFTVRRTNFVPNYKDLTAQVAVSSGGVLDIYNYSGSILISSNANELATLNSYKGFGETVLLQPLGNLTLNATGNIQFPGGETKLIYRAGQPVMLKKNVTKWVVTNSSDSFFAKGTGDPEGVVTAMAGTVYNRVGVQLLYIKTTDGGATGWISVGAIPSIRTASGNGSSTTINIAHGLTYTPVVRSWAANNALSATVKYITADATNFILNFDVAPASGTNNLSYSISYTR